MFPLNSGAIHQLAAEGERFVGWRYLNKAGTRRKIPINPHTGKAASTTDPATWSNLADAQMAVGRDQLAGVGFVFVGDGIVGVDLDLCRDPVTGVLTDRAQKIITDCHTYAEVSPSGTGVKIIGRVDPLPTLTANRREFDRVNGEAKVESIEVYSIGRYFTLTGTILDDVPDEICDMTEAFERLVAMVAEGADAKAERPRQINGQAHGDRDVDPFRRVNSVALARLPDWVLHLFPTAKENGSGVWRVSSDDLGRDLQEDLSLSAAGIKDFGVHDMGDSRHGKRTPIDLVIEFGNAANARAAALWLAELLGIAVPELERGRTSGTSHEAGKAPPAEEEEDGQLVGDLTEDGLAIDMGGRKEWRDSRHVALWGRWLFWNGSRWEMDERLHHMTLTRRFLRSVAAKLDEPPKALRKAATVASVVGLARSNEELVAVSTQWDCDPMLLGTPGGTVDLRTGKLRPARQLDYITKQTGVTPASRGAVPVAFLTFLERIFRHDLELIGYVKRLAGYALTGLTLEQILSFWWGEGGNGKGVLLGVLKYIMGDYAAAAPPDLLLAMKGERHPTDMAMLRGARLVIASEITEGRSWDESKLKALTGGDPITARFMRQDNFTFDPQATLIQAGNHKPSMRSVDEGFRRRVQLLPFLQKIPKAERDGKLLDKLKLEGPLILRWAIDGCLEWQREGLAPPQSVVEASEQYLEAEDVLGQWLKERTERVEIYVQGNKITALPVLFEDWRQWSASNGGPDWGGKRFGNALEEAGVRRAKSGGERGFIGIRLLPKDAPAGQFRADLDG